MQKNDIVRLSVEEMNNLGNGVGHLKNPDGTRGVTVFVPDAVTGDVLDARIIKVNKNFLVARIESLVTPSPLRTDTDFCAAKGCGGCVYRHIGYSHEIEMKKEYVKSAFRKAGLSDVEVEDVRTTGQISGYRNKAQYPVTMTKNGMQAGFFANGTHRVVPAADCPLQPPEFSALTAFLCRFADAHGITAYDEETGKGLLRHVYLRRGTVTGDLMVCLVINGKHLPDEDTLATDLQKAFPKVKSVYLNFNCKNTNVVLGEDYRLLAGTPYIEDVLCGVRFRLSPAAFYQVNHDACELLYGIAKEKLSLTGEETVLDLYCGIGSIGLSMADQAKEIVGIEIVPAAVECAKENAVRAGIENAYFYCGDASNAEKFFADAERLHGTFENATVVMDPPRKGSTPELISYLAKRAFERIVYVSCNPDTLARDCALFRQLGYRIGKATPVDLFPRTGHVETVVLISRI